MRKLDFEKVNKNLQISSFKIIPLPFAMGWKLFGRDELHFCYLILSCEIIKALLIYLFHSFQSPRCDRREGNVYIFAASKRNDIIFSRFGIFFDESSSSSRFVLMGGYTIYVTRCHLYGANICLVRLANMQFLWRKCFECCEIVMTLRMG